MAEGARPGPVEPEDIEPGSLRRGWQHEASSHVDRHFREHVLFDRLPPRDRAQVRSQAGPGASSALTALPTSCHTRIPAHVFRVTLLRRLRLPLPPDFAVQFLVPLFESWTFSSLPQLRTSGSSVPPLDDTALRVPTTGDVPATPRSVPAPVSVPNPEVAALRGICAKVTRGKSEACVRNFHSCVP